jgi:dTDP-4-dehydrorhamnose 3,5-epimerase
MGEPTIPGLHWDANLCAETADRSHTLVAAPASLVSDVHFFRRDAYDDFVVHVGHSTRFTFLGAPGQPLTGDFVDCRRGSPTLRRAVRLEFTPDPRRVLHVAQGIAMRFQGLTNITVRTESTWFASSPADNPHDAGHHDIGNDQIRVPTDTPPSSFPSLSVNELPLPPHVLQILMRRRLEILRDGGSYDTTFDVAVGGEMSAGDRRAAPV